MATFLILIGLIGLVIGGVALAKGRLSWLRIANRKQAGVFAGVSFVVMLVGGGLGAPKTVPSAQRTSTPAPTEVSRSTPALRTGPGPTSPKRLDADLWQAYCTSASQVTDTLKAIQNGTVTKSEVVTQLTKYQKDISDEAGSAEAHGFPGIGARFQAVSDAVARVKVAVDSGSDPPNTNELDIAPLGQQIAALPNCSAPPPTEAPAPASTP